MPQEHLLLTQTLEQELPHIVCAADIRESIFIGEPKLQGSW